MVASASSLLFQPRKRVRRGTARARLATSAVRVVAGAFAPAAASSSRRQHFVFPRRPRHENAARHENLPAFRRAHENACDQFSNEPLAKLEAYPLFSVEAVSHRFEIRMLTSFVSEAERLRFHFRGATTCLESLLSDREEARSVFVKSTRGLNVFVSRTARFRDGRTGATPKAGVVADVGGAGRRRSLRTRDGGERGNRALRDARAAGSWLAPQGVRERMTDLQTSI